MKVEQKTGLSRFYGKRETFSGTVERKGFGKKRGELFHTILLRKIMWYKDGSGEGEVVADHVWMRFDGMEASRYNEGDQIKFTAAVTTYKTGYRAKRNLVGGKVHKSFGFTDIEIEGV